jgi:hypothetical protein
MQFCDAGTVVLGLRYRERTLELAQFGIAIEHKLDGGLIDGRRLLRNVRHHQRWLDLEVTGILMQFAEEQREQAGFAAAIGAGHADLLAAIEGQTGVFEQYLHAAAQLQSAQNYHELRIIGKCGDTSSKKD